MITIGFKYGCVAHAKDWEEVPHVVVSHCGAAALLLPAVIQLGTGWSRLMFGDAVAVYDTPETLAREFPSARVVKMPNQFVPPPLG